MEINNKDKLILIMLCDICEQLGIKHRLDPVFIKKALVNGHTWAIDWKYESMLPEVDDKKEDVTLTSSILDMWNFVERGFENLDESGKKTVVDAHRRQPVFSGFDGNNESTYLGIASCLIDDLDRYQRFAGRDLNSHAPYLERYVRSLMVFTEIRPKLGDRDITADEIVEVLKGRDPDSSVKVRELPF